MAKTVLEDLVKDIYKVLDGKIKPTEEQIDTFSLAIKELMLRRFLGPEREAKLSMSNFGTPCERKLWYKVNIPEKAEALKPWARMKFLYGDLIEELVLWLAEVSGHEVKGRQDTLELHGVEGHRDAVIDGVTVDVKSANSRSFDKFKNHTLEDDDPFGYLDQLRLYVQSSEEGVDKDRGAFLAVDKELGHLVLDEYECGYNLETEASINYKKDMLSAEQPPVRRYDPEPDGRSGNMQLAMPCRYCDHKRTCFPGLRTYLYSNGPRYLTRVVREPEVPELRGG